MKLLSTTTSPGRAFQAYCTPGLSCCIWCSCNDRVTAHGWVSGGLTTGLQGSLECSLAPKPLPPQSPLHTAPEWGIKAFARTQGPSWVGPACTASLSATHTCHVLSVYPCFCWSPAERPLSPTHQPTHIAEENHLLFSLKNLSRLSQDSQTLLWSHHIGAYLNQALPPEKYHILWYLLAVLFPFTKKRDFRLKQKSPLITTPSSIPLTSPLSLVVVLSWTWWVAFRSFLYTSVFSHLSIATVWYQSLEVLILSSFKYVSSRCRHYSFSLLSFLTQSANAL